MMDNRLLLGARVIGSSRHRVIAQWLDVCIIIWRDETLKADVVAAGGVLDRMAKTEPAGVGLVQVVTESAQAPSAEARAEIAAMLRRGSSYIRCSSVVFHGEGFRAASVRAFITGVAWLAQPGFPHQVFADTAEAAGVQSGYFAPKGSEARWSSLLVQVIGKLSVVPER